MDQEMKDMMNELNEKIEDIDKEELKNLIDEMHNRGVGLHPFSGCHIY
jgi:uncharacterized protein YcbK (DUF882 family)